MYNELQNRNINGTLTQKLKFGFLIQHLKDNFKTQNVKGTVQSELKRNF